MLKSNEFESQRALFYTKTKIPISQNSEIIPNSFKLSSILDRNDHQQNIKTKTKTFSYRKDKVHLFTSTSISTSTHPHQPQHKKKKKTFIIAVVDTLFCNSHLTSLEGKRVISPWEYAS